MTNKQAVMTTDRLHIKALGKCILTFILSLPVWGAGGFIHAQERDSIAYGDVSQTDSHDKITNNTRMIGIGGVDILDTYLSQEKYSGTEIRYISHTIREREGKRWARLIVHQGSIAYARNRADNANEMAGAYKFSYGLLHDWRFFGGRLDLKAGGMVDANIGFLYNMRNSNNPAQAQFNIDIAPTAIATYRFRAGKFPMAARYEVSSPLCGIMFSPNFGQSYYEIFSEGDYDHNIVPTTFVSTPSLRQTLSLDITVRNTTIRLGYMADWRQSKVNNLKYHSYSNMFVIGITRSFKLIKMQP